MQGTFLLSYLLIRVVFKLDALNSFIVASCVIGLGLEVEAFREMMGNSCLGYRERFDFSRDQSCAAEAWWTLGWQTYWLLMSFLTCMS